MPELEIDQELGCCCTMIVMEKPNSAVHGYLLPTTLFWIGYDDEFLSFGISYNFNQFRIDIENFVQLGSK